MGLHVRLEPYGYDSREGEMGGFIHSFIYSFGNVLCARDHRLGTSNMELGRRNMAPALRKFTAQWWK